MFAFLFKPAQTPYPKDIRSLTSLRFFAALSIVIFHFTYEIDALREGLPGRFYTGVDFFFILSGFILTHSYIRAIEDGTFSARDFYIKRFARIYPVHIVTLILSALTTAATLTFWGVGFDSGDSWSCLTSSVLMLQAWGIHAKPCFNNPSWSISAEWFAYLLFPLLAAWALKKKPQAVMLLSSVAIILLCILFLYLGKPFTHLTAQGFIRIVPDFVLGIGLYLFGRKYELRKASAGTFYAVVGFMFLCFVLNIPDAVIVLIYALVIYVAAELSRQRVDTALEGAKLVFWGEASYAVYMLHHVIWEALPVPVMMRALDGSKVFDAPFWAACAVALVLTFILSKYTYLYLEKPARAWICRAFIPPEKPKD